MLLPITMTSISRKLRVVAVIPGTADSPVSMIFAKREVDALRDYGVEVRKFFLKSRTSLPILVGEWRRLRREIDSFKPDVIHCHYGTMTAFLTVFATALPVVVTYRGSDLNPVPSVGMFRTMLAHFLSQIAAIRACRIVCVSRELAARLVYGGSKVTVIPEAIDLKIFQPIPRNEARLKLGWTHDAPVVLFNAGASPKVKRIDLCEMAMAVARKKNAGIKLVVMHGDVPPADVPLYHNASDVLLVTSDFEGGPTIVQEAIACGLPVISVVVGDVPQKLNEVFPSRIVERSPEAIATALLEIIALRTRSNGPEVAIRQFSNEIVAPKLVNVLRMAAKDMVEGVR